MALLTASTILFTDEIKRKGSVLDSYIAETTKYAIFNSKWRKNSSF